MPQLKRRPGESDEDYAARIDTARCSRVDFLEHQIRELEDLAADPTTLKRAQSAAVAARAKAADLRGQLDELRAAKRKRPKRKASVDPAEEVLEETRRLRLAASEAGSFVAAANLLKLERDLLVQQQARREQERRERLADMDLDERVSRLVEVLVALPEEIREQVRSAAFDPVH